MKKVFTLLVMSIFLLSFMSTAVLAQENTDVVAASEGLSSEDIASATADEDVQDSSGIWRDKTRAWFTFNKEKKAKIKTRIAKKRMFEVGELAVKHPEKAKRVAKIYEEELDNALEHFDEIAADGDKEQVRRALKRTVWIKYRLENHKAKSAEIHARILENKADQMTEEQLAHLEEVFSMIKDKIDSKIDEVEALQENLIARAVLISELTEEEIRTLLEHFEDSLEQRIADRKLMLEQHRDVIKTKEDFIRKRIVDSERNSVEVTTDSASVSAGSDGSVEVTTDSAAVSVSGDSVQVISLN